MTTYLLNADLVIKTTDTDIDKFLTELKEFCKEKKIGFDVTSVTKTSIDKDEAHLVRPVTCFSCMHYSNYYCGEYGGIMNPNEAWEGTNECSHYYTESDDVMYIHYGNERCSWPVENNVVNTEEGYISFDEMSLEQVVKDASTWIKEIDDILNDEGFVEEHWELRKGA